MFNIQHFESSWVPTNFQHTWWLRYFRSSLGPGIFRKLKNCHTSPIHRGLPRLCRCIQTCCYTALSWNLCAEDKKWWEEWKSGRVEEWKFFCVLTHRQRSESGNSWIAQHRERLLTTGRSADKFKSNIQMCSGGSAPKFLWHQGSVSQSDMIRFVSGQDPWL